MRVLFLALLPCTLCLALDAPAVRAEPAPALEVNVIWPFFPGGMSDFLVLVPVLPTASGEASGLVVGAFSDFAWRSVRKDDAGRVAILGASLGWRQFVLGGWHLEALLHAGWRHEENNPWDGEVIHSFQGRLWTWAGYQRSLSPRFYVNLRAGVGIHAFRTDRFADKERMLAPAADGNFGVRF